MVRADKGGAGISVQVPYQLRAAVRATVVQHLNAAVTLAHHDHGLASDGHSVVVARRLDLRFMTAVNPGTFPDFLHFGIKDHLVGINVFMHTIGFNELLYVHCSVSGMNHTNANSFSSACPLSSASAAWLRSRNCCAPCGMVCS